MRLPVEIKEKALSLRRKGFSIKEIAKTLNVAQGTSSIWVRNVLLNKQARKRLEKRKLICYYNAGIAWKQKRERRDQIALIGARAELQKINPKKEELKLYCALLYWCEGTKGERETVQFTNSDAELIKLFLTLLRKSFVIKEQKFRVALHLHSYHNEKKQNFFWSQLTKIPQSQFRKTYWKPNTKKRIKDNYPGCIKIIYHDINIARELKAIFKEFARGM